MRLDPVVITVNEQQGADDLAKHRLADVEARRDGASLDRLCEDGTGRVAGPADPVLDLLCRVRLREDVADEMLDEIGIVRLPIAEIIFVPAVEPFAIRGEVGGAKKW